jgi:hypothetical protein
LNIVLFYVIVHFFWVDRGTIGAKTADLRTWTKIPNQKYRLLYNIHPTNQHKDVRDKETFPIPIWSQRANGDSIFPSSHTRQPITHCMNNVHVNQRRIPRKLPNDLAPHVQSQHNSYGRSTANQDNYTHRANHNKKLLSKKKTTSRSIFRTISITLQIIMISMHVWERCLSQWSHSLILILEYQGLSFPGLWWIKSQAIGICIPT